MSETPSPLDARAAQKRRNLWLALALFGFVALVGITTMIRLMGADLSKGGFYYMAPGEKAKAVEAGATDLPPGMTAEQAAPPPGLEAEPAPPSEPDR
jgi:hypothetical protein